MRSPRRSSRRPGFSLVELLTVIGIISLLIAILMPSLGRAREQARKTRSAALLKAMGTGLEMFNNDFGQYPDSSTRLDPVIDWTNGLDDNAPLSGAHWVARALIGHDLQGVDANQYVLRGGQDTYEITYDAVAGMERKNAYIEDSNVFARDDDRNRFNQSGSPATGRIVMFDSFDYPIIYYRARPRAQQWLGPDAGVYVHEDNARITGRDYGTSLEGWDFGGSGFTGTDVPVHPLGQIGAWDGGDPEGTPPVDGDGNPAQGKTFAEYMHNHAAHAAGGVLKPYRAESFILISAGPDGRYGTDDDVNNFGEGL